MTTESQSLQIHTVLEFLNDSDPNIRAATLRTLTAAPLKSPEILLRLKQLAEDNSICVVGTSFVYSEIKYLAAKAIGAVTEREVQLCGVMQPTNISTKEFRELRSSQYTRGYSLVAVLQDLRDRGCTPEVDVLFKPG